MGQSNAVTISENPSDTTQHLSMQTGQHQKSPRTSHPSADVYSNSYAAGSTLCNTPSDAKEECKFSIQEEKRDRFFAKWDGIS